MKINKIRQRSSECVATAIAILADLYKVKIDPVKLDNELRAYFKIKEGKGISVFRALSYLKRKKVIKSWKYRKQSQTALEKVTVTSVRMKPFLLVFKTNCTAKYRISHDQYVPCLAVITGSHAVVGVGSSGDGYEIIDPQYGTRKYMYLDYYNEFYKQSYYINF